MFDIFRKNEGGGNIDSTEEKTNVSAKEKNKLEPEFTFSDPVIESQIAINYQFPEYEGRELRPGQKIVFSIPEEFKGRIVRDIILKHRKGDKYKVDIGQDGYDPYGAYSRVEVHDTQSGNWVNWRDPAGYNPDKFAEPRSAGDPENEVLHDWVATVGQVKPDAIRVVNVGKNSDYSVSQIHGVEVIFFPELEGVSYRERIYTEGTEFVDLEKDKNLPRYGGGEHTGGVYENAIPLNYRGSASYELGNNPGDGARIENGTLYLGLEAGKDLIQAEMSIGDTEYRERNSRLGWAKLWVGIKRADSGEVEWFIKNMNVPPQGVLAGAPLVGRSKINPGDELVVQSRADTAYLMGWRLAYK